MKQAVKEKKRREKKKRKKRNVIAIASKVHGTQSSC